MHTEVQYFYHMIWRIFSWKHQCQEQSIWEYTLNIPHQTLEHFIRFMDLLPNMDISTSISQKSCTAWNRKPSFPIINLFLAWSHMGITHFHSQLDYGPTKQELFLASVWMILVLNISANMMQTIFSTHSKTAMKFQQIGRVIITLDWKYIWITTNDMWIYPCQSMWQKSWSTTSPQSKKTTICPTSLDNACLRKNTLDGTIFIWERSCWQEKHQENSIYCGQLFILCLVSWSKTFTSNQWNIKGAIKTNKGNWGKSHNATILYGNIPKCSHLL